MNNTVQHTNKLEKELELKLAINEYGYIRSMVAIETMAKNSAGTAELENRAQELFSRISKMVDSL